MPDQFQKVLNADFTDDNDLSKPLKRFPETFTEEER